MCRCVWQNSDLADFCSKYAVVKNGEQLVGGYSENKLVSYALTAEVNAQTNGLKYAAKSGDGYHLLRGTQRLRFRCGR